MRKIVLTAFGLLALAAGVAVSMPSAEAYSCNTYCYGRNCTTNCF